MVQVQHRPHKAEAVAKDGGQLDCPPQTQPRVWCPSHYDVKNICNDTDSTSDCLVKGMQLCETKPECFGVGVEPGWWTKEENGVKLCTSATLVEKNDWCTTICPLQSQNGVWCPEHVDEKGVCNESDSTRECLAKGKKLCDTRPKCFGVGVHPGWWTATENGVKICTSATLAEKKDWCTAITKRDCEEGFWCPDHDDAPGICEDADSLNDCLVKGKKLCEDNAECFGVGIHPGWWTKDQNGVKFCTSSTLVTKEDWCTKITKNGT